METKANYVLIGAFTIVVSLFLLLFALWAAKYSSEKSWQEYMVVFNEPVTGLSEGSSVQYNGISVGTVERLSLAPDDPRRVRALLRIQAKAPVKTVYTREDDMHGGYYRPPLVIRPRPDHDRPPQRDNDSRAPWRDLDQIKRIRSGSPGIQRAATTPRPAVQRPAVSAPVRPAVRASDGRGSRTQQAIRRARTQAREVER